MTQDQYNELRIACLANAKAFLVAAKKLTNPSSRHISYHLAALGLEEIGKLEMVGMQTIVSPERATEDRINLDIEDHERKLFWALWGASFGKNLITKEHVEEHKGLAKAIHETRLASLYVNVRSPSPPGKAISKAKLDNILQLTEARIGMSRYSGEMRVTKDQLNAREKKVMGWFLSASSDPLERKFMFSGVSNKKLVKFGDAKKWVNWLYDEAEKRQDEGQQMLNDELKRQQPVGKEKLEPKWSMKIKLTTPSHSIRQKNLDRWNNGVERIKLHGAKDKHTLTLELILPKNVPLLGVWDEGWGMSKAFVASLNLATQGFFWWNTNAETSKFYDEVKDLERPGFIVAPQLAKKLELNWQELKLVLDDKALGKTALIFSFITSLPDNEKSKSALNKYLTALAIWAKSDLHLRLEINAWHEFYDALKDAVVTFGDQQKDEQIEETLRRIIPKEIHESLERCIDLDHNKPEVKITLTDVACSKLLIDYYLGIKANQWANQQKKLKKKT